MVVYAVHDSLCQDAIDMHGQLPHWPSVLIKGQVALKLST